MLCFISSYQISTSIRTTCSVYSRRVAVPFATECLSLVLSVLGLLIGVIFLLGVRRWAGSVLLHLFNQRMHLVELFFCEAGLKAVV